MAALVTLLRLLRRTVALRAPFGLFLFPQWIARWTIYPLSGRRAWWPGYEVARHQRVYATLNDPDLMRRFAQNAPLPPGYGTRLDERVVEYPWVLARLGPDAHDLLDAGSTLNWPYLLDHPLLREKRIALLTLAPELWYLPDHRLSYLFGDLRETRLRSGAFDAVTCISTLEHIGMDNSRYTGMADRAGGLHAALDELRRVIRPGGTLLLTVPYGQPADLGWQQVFGPSALADILDRLGGMVRDQAIYCYSADGWQIADEDGCAGAVYHDFLAERRPPPDGAAAARAVACVQIQY